MNFRQMLISTVQKINSCNKYEKETQVKYAFTLKEKIFF